jgi:hypothetical protein
MADDTREVRADSSASRTNIATSTSRPTNGVTTAGDVASTRSARTTRAVPSASGWVTKFARTNDVVFASIHAPARDRTVAMAASTAAPVTASPLRTTLPVATPIALAIGAATSANRTARSGSSPFHASTPNTASSVPPPSDTAVAPNSRAARATSAGLRASRTYAATERRCSSEAGGGTESGDATTVGDIAISDPSDDTARNAKSTASMPGGRASRLRLSDVSISVASGRGSTGAIEPIDGAVSERILNNSPGALSDSNGIRPVSISKSTTPSDQTSARASMSESPLACSGGMYAHVPIGLPVTVSFRSPPSCAIPKSSSLTRSKSPAHRNTFAGLRSR